MPGGHVVARGTRPQSLELESILTIRPLYHRSLRVKAAANANFFQFFATAAQTTVALYGHRLTTKAARRGGRAAQLGRRLVSKARRQRRQTEELSPDMDPRTSSSSLLDRMERVLSAVEATARAAKFGCAFMSFYAGPSVASVTGGSYGAILSVGAVSANARWKWEPWPLVERDGALGSLGRLEEVLTSPGSLQ